MASVRAFIYLLKAGKYYKIGVTTSVVEKRIAELQTGNPLKIRCFHYEDIKNEKRMFILERLLHEEYKHCRAEGEWFLPTHNEVNEIVLKMKRLQDEYVMSEYLKLRHKQKTLPHNPTRRMKKGEVELQTKATVEDEIINLLIGHQQATSMQ